MAEILQNAFQNVIEEQGEMEDKKQKKAPAIDSVIVTRPDFIQLLKLGEKEVASDEGADAVQVTSPEFNPKPTQSSMNDAGTDTITAKEANERAPDEKADSAKATEVELNPKLTKPGENDAASTKAPAAEAKAAASDEGASPVIATAAELNPNRTKPTAKDAVIDATLMVEDSEAMATAPDSIPMVITTKDNGVSVSQGEVSQPPSVNQMLLDLKQKIAEAKENKSSDATAEVSVELAMVSLSSLSAMLPIPGPKADKYQPATQYTPSPGPMSDKNRAMTRSTPSADPKKRQSPLSAGADESLMHSGRNFDALVGMDSLCLRLLSIGPYVFTSTPKLTLTMPTILCMISVNVTFVTCM
jgi:hypothetical protein